MYKPYTPNENLIFPPNLGDFIPEDAPVRLISEIVDQLDLKEVHDSYSKSSDGQPPYNPVMLLKVVLFGYMNNIFSTRGLEEAMRRDAHLIWLSSYQFPDHSTISRFKTRCMPFIKKIFAGLVTILVKKGEIKLSEDLHIDGSTIRSRAARRKIKWRSNYERFSASADEDIQEAVNGLLDQVEKGDSGEEHERQGHTGRYTPEEARRIADEIEERSRKEGLKKTRGKIKAVRDACDRKETHDKVVEQCKGRCGVAPTDPDCGIMHAKEDGYDGNATPNYNVQIATQNQYITNFDAYDSAEDKSIAMDFVNTCIEENGVKPKSVVEDAGYGCEEVYVGLGKLQIEAVVKYPNYDAESTRRPVKEGRYDKLGFKLSDDENTLICPNGKLMRVLRVEEGYTKSGFRSDTTVMTCDHCENCPFKQQCILTRSKHGEIHRRLGNIREERKAKKRLDLPENQRKLKRRSLEPEPVFGQLKHNHGYTRFRHFGKSKVRMDLGFELMALNVLKFFDLCDSKNLQINFANGVGAEPARIGPTLSNMGIHTKRGNRQFEPDQIIKYLKGDTESGESGHPVLLYYVQNNMVDYDDNGVAYKVAGHTWVIDGEITYLVLPPTLGMLDLDATMFHCVWGWGGKCNGYFYWDKAKYDSVDNQFSGKPDKPDEADQGYSVPVYRDKHVRYYGGFQRKLK